MRTRHPWLKTLGGIACAGVVAAPLIVPVTAYAAPSLPPLVINEVIQDNDAIADAIEVLNLGDTAVDISGWILADDKNSMPVSEGTVVQPGQYLAITVDDDTRLDKFGLGKADQANLKLPDGTLVDTYAWSGHVSTSYGRCVDGTGDFRVTVEATPNAANACVATPLGNIKINEVESNGDTEDWVELTNISDWEIDIAGLVLTDNDPTHTYEIPAGTALAPGEFAVLNGGDFGFGLGGADAARLLDGGTVVDEYAWTAHAAHTYGRCPDGLGEFASTALSTKGGANDCAAPEIPAIVVNEVESSDGTPGDWIELFNLSDAAVDLTGWVVRDNDDAHVSTLPAGSTIEAGGFFVVEEAQLGFGLGKADSARVYLPGGHTLVDSYSWTATVDDQHAPTTFGRCPDGTGEWKITTASTKGASNDCGMAVRINEVETSDDWVELINVGFESVDLGGMKLRDGGAGNDAYVFAPGIQLAAGGYLQVAVKETFGLGKDDRVTLFAADDAELDSVSWLSHPVPSLGRCPDGTGDFVNTREATPGAANACVGDLIVDAWPGAEGMATVDVANTFGTDMSGVVFEDGGVIWAVNNGNGTLHKLQLTGGSLTEADGWVDGRTLRYPDGTGTVDAEGVALIAGSSANGVLVASERNTGGTDGGSRPSVLRFDVAGTGDLVATHEWNLATDYPGIGANAGVEGVAWIADSELTAAGLIDETTGAVYDPASYPAHLGGVVFVGVEASNTVAGYVLGEAGEMIRIAEFETAFPGVMELEYDPSTALLWVVCDEVCDGRSQVFKIGASESAPGAFAPVATYERPAGTSNFANEGFAIAPIDQCTDGSRAVIWANDDQTDGHAFRVGSIDCVGDETGGETGGSTPDGSTPGGSTPGGSTTPPSVTSLTDSLRGGISAPGELRAGSTVTITVGAAYAGQTVNVWLFSTPVHLGSPVVSATGTVTVALPTDLPTGTHRLVVAAADGSVIGWQNVQVVGRSTGGVLASTGVDPAIHLMLAGGSAVLLLLAATATALGRRTA
ncbi:lamin tail domain-containing protein [Leucobacter sp. W1038]|uniref:lamin tail domain-containing protein n=1 Tax=Leucobacter sp. W1038 TaxID=3438281 RepID=UPI003D9545F3